MTLRYHATTLVLLVLVIPVPAQEASIRVDAGKVTAHIGKHLTGACIEDVNHEIYGGLYSQMVFGESFQEPSAQSPVKGFHVYAGRWSVADGELRAGAGA